LNNGRIGISGKLLFELNSDRLEPEGRQLLKSLVVPLRSYLQSRDEMLMVSGFTDDKAIGQRNRQFEDNWELSAQRALTVTRTLIEEGMPASLVRDLLDRAGRTLDALLARTPDDPATLRLRGVAHGEFANTFATLGDTPRQRQAAEAALDAFTDTYLGAFSSDPTLDNDGNALSAGDLYFSTAISRRSSGATLREPSTVLAQATIETMDAIERERGGFPDRRKSFRGGRC
jgi:hypothetical protein